MLPGHRAGVIWGAALARNTSREVIRYETQPICEYACRCFIQSATVTGVLEASQPGRDWKSDDIGASIARMSDQPMRMDQAPEANELLELMLDTLRESRIPTHLWRSFTRLALIEREGNFLEYGGRHRRRTRGNPR